MNPALAIVFIMFLAPVGAFGLVAVVRLWRGLRRWPLEDVDTPELRSAHMGPYGPAVLHTRPPLHPLTLASGGGREDGPPEWVATAQAPLAAARSWFSIERRALLNSSPLGAIEVGSGVDERYVVDGDNVPALRAWFADAGVRAALDAAFADDAVISVHLEESGQLTGRFGLVDINDLDRAARLAVATARFVALVEEGSQRVPTRSEGQTSGAGPAHSGTPVAVPAHRPR